MDWNQVQSNWMQFKDRVKQKWSKLSDDEIERIGGQRDQLVGKLQERYGIAREEANSQVEQWERSL